MPGIITTLVDPLPLLALLLTGLHVLGHDKQRFVSSSYVTYQLVYPNFANRNQYDSTHIERLKDIIRNRSASCHTGKTVVRGSVASPNPEP